MNQWFKNIFPGLYGLLNYFTIRLLQDTNSHSHFWRRPSATTLTELVVSIAVGYLAIGGVTLIINRTEKGQAPGTATASRFSRELFLVMLFAELLANSVLLPFAAFTDDGLSLSDIAEINTIPLLYTLIYYGIVRSRAYLKAYVQNQLLVEKLTNDQLDTELKFLRSQYHPHFLFNALNTIYFQVDEDVPGAKKSIELLSELLRYQLYDRQHQVSIQQELDYLHNYLLLQKLRASEKMKLDIDFDPLLKEQQIYPLLFLPLVENAFKYVGGSYQILIMAQQTTSGLLFTVANDLPDAIAAPTESSGIGLENLHRRLELLYPGRHRLTLNRQPERYVAQLELNF